MERMLFPDFKLGEAARLYKKRFETRSRALGLDFLQCTALLVLAENEGVTQQRLSQLTAIAPPWLVRTLDRLAALGLAERRHLCGDRRARAVFITERTKVLLPTLRKFLDESLCEALSGLSADEIRILAKALERVSANLSRSQAALSTRERRLPVVRAPLPLPS